MALHFISSFLPQSHLDIPFFLSFLLTVNLDLTKTSTTTFTNVNFNRSFHSWRHFWPNHCKMCKKEISEGTVEIIDISVQQTKNTTCLAGHFREGARGGGNLHIFFEPVFTWVHGMGIYPFPQTLIKWGGNGNSSTQPCCKTAKS